MKTHRDRQARYPRGTFIMCAEKGDTGQESEPPGMYWPPICFAKSHLGDWEDRTKGLFSFVKCGFLGSTQRGVEGSMVSLEDVLEDTE